MFAPVLDFQVLMGGFVLIGSIGGLLGLFERFMS